MKQKTGQMERKTGQKSRRKRPGKSYTGNGVLFEPEFLECVSRLKRREPELGEVVKRGRRD